MFFEIKAKSLELARLAGFDEARLESITERDYRSPNLVHVHFENLVGRSYVLAQRIASWLAPPSWCLFYLTEYGIWPSSENLHLYYRLRQSYGDNRPLPEAPGHYFLRHETADLVTFIDLALQFGWGGHLFPGLDDKRMFLSHDGWLRIDAATLDQNMIASIEALKLPYWAGQPH
jgi:hypothetical protein